MTVTQDLSFLTLITDASIPVQLVMLLLLGVTVTSWTYIFSKMFAIKRARAQTEDFERSFWSGGSLVELYQAASANRRSNTNKTGALERIFEAGMSEYHKVKTANKGTMDGGKLVNYGLTAQDVDRAFPAKIFPDLVAYYQGDPRGASLYIVKRSELNGSDIHANYSKGVAIYA